LSVFCLRFSFLFHISHLKNSTSTNSWTLKVLMFNRFACRSRHFIAFLYIKTKGIASSARPTHSPSPFFIQSEMLNRTTSICCSPRSGCMLALGRARRFEGILSCRSPGFRRGWHRQPICRVVGHVQTGICCLT
jgi:hypothetical protein